LGNIFEFGKCENIYLKPSLLSYFTIILSCWESFCFPLSLKFIFTFFILPQFLPSLVGKLPKLRVILLFHAYHKKAKK